MSSLLTSLALDGGAGGGGRPGTMHPISPDIPSAQTFCLLPFVLRSHLVNRMVSLMLLLVLWLVFLKLYDSTAALGGVAIRAHESLQSHDAVDAPYSHVQEL